jgi:hypothetical protein
MRAVVFWLPIVVWLGVEIYLLQGVCSACGGLSQSCPGGGDCSEIAGIMGVWGLPASLLPGLLLHIVPCGTLNSVVLALIFCAAGVIQWYFIMRGVELLLTKLYRWLRPAGRASAV